MTDPSHDSAPAWVQQYQPGVPATIDVPDEPLSALLRRASTAGGDEIALEFFGATTSWRELSDQVSRLAHALVHRFGVRPGDRVALLLPNCPQHVVAFYAALRVGAVVVEHNPLYTAPELAEMFADHGATVAIAWDVAAPKIAGAGVEHLIAVNLLDAFPLTKRLALALPVPKLRATRDRLHRAAPGGVPWREVVSGERLADDHPAPTVADLAVIQYTSGTTGRVKGAMLSHRNLYANALQGAAWMTDAVDGAETIYAVLPMFHAFGMTLYLTFGVLKRARIVLFPTFDVDQVLAVAKKRPPSVYCAVPPIYERTAKAAAERGISLRSARFCISGAMALTDEVVELWESVSGGLLVEGYGLTECSPVALGNPFWPTRRTGTVGVPFPSTLMRVVDPEDTSREIAPGETGELLLHGPQVFGGYWNKPADTQATLLPGGWLRTGDLVTVDADGFTTVVDRLKELIITGGFNVSPTEVEQALRQVDGVADAAVVGLPSSHSGEQVVAVVVPEPGATLDPATVRQACRGRLAAYKVPRRVHVVDELPKSMLGKVLRKQVRDALLADDAAVTVADADLPHGS
ncbi:AMP-binding protein [Propioniciclava coleopterorum]|uniref:AMP-binding protein n=1 Tax=Propioniciclava coleopterorum TaxID=2714937 RepID=A0A6G7Y8C5_9ACTN|nr:long-chain-fatty-acid--CoA ligase [Propioniciclava coleopterorum]QIK73030.1 AMP-binding protein [Propioniciclava coleopterorum]